MSKSTIVLIVLGILLITNTVAFLLMKIDKKRAQRSEWRIKEKTLFLSAFLFGALGGVLGMKVFRHKTKHWYFKVFFPVFLVLQVALLVWGGVLLFK